jgi:hypothetical protein
LRVANAASIRSSFGVSAGSFAEKGAPGQYFGGGADGDPPGGR